MSLQTALIVDDSKSARFGLRKMLEKNNLAVAMCESGEQAIQYLETEKPDVIFMDHIMPGMDGFEATKVIKGNDGTANIPVVMCTSKEGDEYEREALSIGAFSILPKPANMASLRTTFEKISSELGMALPTEPVAAAAAAPKAATPPPVTPKPAVAATAPAAPSASKEELEKIVASQLLEKLNELKAELVDETAAKASEIARAEASNIAKEGAKAASELVNAKLSDFSAELTELSNSLANLSPGESGGLAADLDIVSLKEELREMAQSQAVETSRSEALQAAAEQIDTKLAELSGQVENRLNLIIQQLEQQQSEYEAGADRDSATVESLESLKAEFSSNLNSQVGALKTELSEKLAADVSALKAGFSQELSDRLEAFRPEPGPDLDSLLEQRLQSHGDQLQQQLTTNLEDKFETLRTTLGASASSSDETISELKQQVAQVLESQSELKSLSDRDTSANYEAAISELKEQISEILAAQSELKSLGSATSNLEAVSEESVAELKEQVSKLLSAQDEIRELTSDAEGVDMDEIKVVADSVANEMFDTRMEAVTKELTTDVGGQLEEMKTILNSPRPMDPEVLNDLKSMMKTTAANEVKKAVDQAKKELIKQSEQHAAAPVMSDVVHGPASWKDNAVLFGAAIVAGGLCAAGVIFLVG